MATYYLKRAEVAEAKLNQQIRKRRKYQWVARRQKKHIESQGLYIVELKAEIARHHKDFEKWEEMADRGARLIAENENLRQLFQLFHVISGINEEAFVENAAGYHRLHDAATGLLNTLNRYDPGWPHPDSELHQRMVYLRTTLANR